MITKYGGDEAFEFELPAHHHSDPLVPFTIPPRGTAVFSYIAEFVFKVLSFERLVKKEACDLGIFDIQCGTNIQTIPLGMLCCEHGSSLTFDTLAAGQRFQMRVFNPAAYAQDFAVRVHGIRLVEKKLP